MLETRLNNAPRVFSSDQVFVEFQGRFGLKWTEGKVSVDFESSNQILCRCVDINVLKNAREILHKSLSENSNVRPIQKTIAASVFSWLEDHLADADSKSLSDDLFGHVQSLDVGCLLPEVRFDNACLSC